MDICFDLLMVHRLGGAERLQSEALEVGSPSVEGAELKKYPPAGESLRLVEGRSCMRLIWSCEDGSVSGPENFVQAIGLQEVQSACRPGSANQGNCKRDPHDICGQFFVQYDFP